MRIIGEHTAHSNDSVLYKEERGPFHKIIYQGLTLSENITKYESCLSSAVSQSRGFRKKCNAKLGTFSTCVVSVLQRALLVHVPYFKTGCNIKTEDQSWGDDSVVQRTWVCFPAPTWWLRAMYNSSSRDPTPSSGFCGHQAYK